MMVEKMNLGFILLQEKNNKNIDTIINNIGISLVQFF